MNSPSVAAVTVVEHGGHEHRWTMEGWGPFPPVLPLRCGSCQRAIRSVSVDGSGRLSIVGGFSVADGGTMNATTRRRAAMCYDATPGGCEDAQPTHYRFVCPHRGQRNHGPVLDRTLRAETLREHYLDVVCHEQRDLMLSVSY